MSDVYTDQAALLQAGRFVERAKVGLPMQATIETYTTASLAQGSTIHCLKPPKGFILLGGILYWKDQGTGVTMEIGISGALTKFLGSTDVASADGSAPFAPVFADTLYTFDGDTEILITTGGGTATGDIKMAYWGLRSQ